ncbi:MAG: LysR family transcriptional regulator [Candidatus Muirbacterium halophilum]|nr:LysR family transcriptional regulator [Candidatus Muirbacterium halophilum]MCK9476687.1 LysR family transcriptional regulator [Candidatus Muirbacterium halophilum]
MKNVSVDGKFWLKNNKDICISEGKIELIKKVVSEGSISKAAKKMQMSYKAAWDMIEEINSFTSSVIIEKNRGGKNGGGCQITSFGKNFLKKYDKISEEYSEMIKKLNKKTDDEFPE